MQLYKKELLNCHVQENIKNIRQLKKNRLEDHKEKLINQIRQKFSNKENNQKIILHEIQSKITNLNLQCKVCKRNK